MVLQAMLPYFTDFFGNPASHHQYGWEAEAVIAATVLAHDETYQLSYLEFPGGRFSVPRNSLPQGRRVRVRVLARDVSLTLERQKGTSILNIFPATVDEVVQTDAALMLVRLDLAGSPLLARITRKSAAELAVHAGQRLFAQVKAVALLE